MHWHNIMTHHPPYYAGMFSDEFWRPCWHVFGPLCCRAVWYVFWHGTKLECAWHVVTYGPTSIQLSLSTCIPQFLTYDLASFKAMIHNGILTGLSSAILSSILSGIPSGMFCILSGMLWHSTWHILWLLASFLKYLLTSRLIFGSLSVMYSGIPSRLLESRRSAR